MAKVTLTDLTSLANDTSATNSINTNFQTLEDYINNNVLSRDTGAEVNTMQNNLDMNNKDLTNVSTIHVNNILLQGTAIPSTNAIQTVNYLTAYTAESGTSFTPDMSSYANFHFTLTGNSTINNPSTEVVGASGLFAIIQSNGGSNTITWGNQFEFTTGASPVLSTNDGDVDLIPYYVLAEGRILCGNILTAFG